MGGKRQRLDEDGRRVRQLELELELARLRREENDQESAAAGDVAEEDDSEDPVVVPTPPPPPPAPQAMPYVATPATAPRNRQQRADLTTPRAGPSSVAASNATRNRQHPPALIRGRGRGRDGGHGGRAPRERGLLTVFVCLAHDVIFCQDCNTYEPSDRYWERH